MPLLRVEGRSSGEQADLKSQPTITLPDALAQASTLTPALLIEWWVELRRRLERATALVSLGLPDPGFKLLAQEIAAFNQTCQAVLP